MREISKQFNFREREDEIYKLWERSGFFNPDNLALPKKAKKFSLVLPPPNVTGYLHIGHAVMLAIEDIMVRYHRMKGDRTLWLPGTDHAAIATQEKVERMLYEKEKKTRHDLGRKNFLKLVDEFAHESHDNIVRQIKKMGSSVDWSREAFTLDEKRSLAVRTAFKKMYDTGIIYRGHRIVNWDPRLKTTVSDDEMERKAEKTTFYYLQYGPFVIGTARPETKFGDKYVVVHPKDKRYTKYKHGQKIELEWINGLVTATVIKDEAIDMEFGTGAMTITPWHDATDFEIAERHNLEKEQIIDFDGKLLPIAGEFAGMEAIEARENIVSKLEEKGLMVKKDENYVHDIAVNSRGGGVIEPQIKEQWFVDVNKKFKQKGKVVTLKKLMRSAVESGRIEIIPKRFEKIYFHWIDNLRDWCVSRQIWYGHRIPVWYKGKEIYCDVNPPREEGWQQDPDTLDTWFSSGLWTFSTLGWPEKTKDLKTYHPTTVLETGYDILFFWVARMILMSTYLLGEIPFEKVYLHGLVRDEKGRKMSKSLGNVIDPLDVAEKFGTDAVRLALVIGTTPGNDIRMSEEKIASFRNFVTKLWNIFRYSVTANADFKLVGEISKKDLKTLSDRWIVSRLHVLIKEMTEDLENYRFSLAGEKLYNFSWNEFADWYVEISKIEKNAKTLGYVFDKILKLSHPFTPFVTEEIYRTLEGNKGMLMAGKWPKTQKELIDKKAESSFNGLKDLIVKIRNVRANYHITPAKTIEAYSEKTVAEKEIIEKLGRVKITTGKIKGRTVKVSSRMQSLNLDIAKLIDAGKELEAIKKERKNLENLIVKNEAVLENKSFLEGAPAEVVKATRARLSEYKEKLKTQKELEKNLRSLTR